MSKVVLFQNLAQYNEWMNQQLYATCAQLPDTVRKEERGAFFQSIHRTLNHLLFGDYAWLGRFTGNPFRAPDLGQHLFAEFAALRNARSEMDQTIIAWTQALTEDWLNEPFTYTSNVYQQTRVLPAWLLVSHMFNHQTHHRGQVTTLLTQLGHDVGVTDLPWMPEGRLPQG